MKIRLAAPLQTESIVDGKGIRMVVWNQGCRMACPGCHNPETHSLCGGKEVDLEDIEKEITKQPDGWYRPAVFCYQAAFKARLFPCKPLHEPPCMLAGMLPAFVPLPADAGKSGAANAVLADETVHR